MHTKPRRRGERPIVRATAELVLGRGKGRRRWSTFRGSLTRRLSVEGDHQRHGFRVGDGTTDATK